MGDVSPRTYYQRQLRVPGWGTAGQDRLAAASALMVGVGGLGCPALGALARAGVGRLVFCDPDRVETSNLPRQTLFGPADVGQPKVAAAARALAMANPWIALEPRAERVDASNVRSLVESVDLVIDGTDNFATKFLLHDACRSAGTPLVMASLYQWEAQVMVFAFRPGEPGCWRCLYPEAPEDGCVGVCADVGVAGALAGAAGNLQALAATRLLLGQAGPEPCSQLILDAEEWVPRTVRWKPQPDCACQRGRGDWTWLDHLRQTTTPVLEAAWEQIAPSDRQIVIDVRESSEILDDEWPWLQKEGSAVLHYPWASWSQRSPVWESDKTYALLCARGIRSMAALRTVPTGIRAISVAGGVAALRREGSLS